MQRVTVVISTYNRPVKLVQAIRSVIRQTFSDWELWVVGDCCTESTRKTVSRIADPRVHFVNTPERHGLKDHGSTPKNIGVENGSGEFVAYLDDDDEFMPDHLEKSVAFLEEHPDIDLVYGCSKVFKFFGPRSVVRDREFDKASHDKAPFINTCEIVHRRSLLDKLNDGWWRTVGYFNDYDFLKRVSEVGKIGHSKHVAATQHYPHHTLLAMERNRVKRRGLALPKISIIVVARNQPKHLKECIKRLNQQRVAKSDFEVIVVNQGFGDKLPPFDGRISRVVLPRMGSFRAWGFNVGAKNAISDFLCFFDCNSMLTLDAVEKLIEMSKDQVCVTPTWKELSEPLSADYLAEKVSFKDAFNQSPSNNSVSKSGLCISRKLFFSLRGFDERYDSGVDIVDMTSRINWANDIAITDKPMYLQLHGKSYDKRETIIESKYLNSTGDMIEKDLDGFLHRNPEIDWGNVPREIL